MGLLRILFIVKGSVLGFSMLGFLLICFVTGDDEIGIHELDHFIKHTVKCRSIPGLAVSMVKEDKVVFSRGYGYRDIEEGIPASEHTKFCIGSLTKAFTTALIADILSKNISLTWDTPIRDILGPEFQLSDELRTKNVNIRDLLAHRVGTPSNFHPLLVGFPENVTRKDLVRRLQYMPAVSDFRSKFHYSNYMYMLAGHVAEVIAGESWEDLVRKRLFNPVGMRDTGFVDKLDKLDEIAAPYVLKNRKLTAVDKDLVQAVSPSGPAGSIFSTASDMAKWMLFHLREGQTKGKRLLVDKTWLQEVYKSQMTHPFPEKDLLKPKYPITDATISYNMGWMTSVYRGYKKVWHSGGIVTYTSQLWLFPDLKAGVFVTASGTLSPYSSAVIRAITARASDFLLEEEPWLNLTSVCTYPAPWETRRNVHPATGTFHFSWNITRQMKVYEGVYGHLGFGDLSVRIEDSEKLNLYFGRFGKMRLQPLDDRSFKGFYTDKLWFITNSDGETKGIKMEFIFSESPYALGLRFPIDFQEKRTLFSRDLSDGESVSSSSSGTYTSLTCDSGLQGNMAHTPPIFMKTLILSFLHLFISLALFK